MPIITLDDYITFVNTFLVEKPSFFAFFFIFFVKRLRHIYAGTP